MKPLTPAFTAGALATTLLAGTTWFVHASSQHGMAEARAPAPVSRADPLAVAPSVLHTPTPATRTPRTLPADAPGPFEREVPLALGVGSGGAGASFTFRRRAKADAARQRESGLGPLAQVQEEDGRWSVVVLAGGTRHPGSCPCADPAHALDDAGLTSLALLALLGEGNTTHQGPHSRTVARGFQWLSAAQDRVTGRIGERARWGWLYNHVLATVALGEAYYFTRDPRIESSYSKALRALELARIPGSAWGSELRGTPPENVYVSAWAVSTLVNARECELTVDEDALRDTLAWLDAVTDPHTGVVLGGNEQAATAAALWIRVRLGAGAKEDEHVARGLAYLAELHPLSRPDALACELGGAFFGSYAAFCGGAIKAWKAWSVDLRGALRELWESEQATIPVREGLVSLHCAAVYYRYASVLVR